MIDKRRTRRGESRYEVRLRGGDGKERSRTFRTKKEAERYERSQHTALEHGLWVDPRAGKVTLEAWAGEWERTVVHLRPSTRRIYAANLRNHIVPQLGNIELGKLTPRCCGPGSRDSRRRSEHTGNRWLRARWLRPTARSTGCWSLLSMTSYSGATR